MGSRSCHRLLEVATEFSIIGLVTCVDKHKYESMLYKCVHIAKSTHMLIHLELLDDDT